MKKPLIIALALLSAAASGQNLVPNPSFEDTIMCPDGVDQVNRADGWIGLATSDYYNMCAPQLSTVSVPSNMAGNQVPSTGQAYCGFFNMELSNFGEYITRGLSDTLVTGQTYFISLKISFGNNPVFINCATNNMGVLLSVDSVTSPPVNDTAHLHSTAVITDSLTWTIIAGSFVADSAYKYITIGNFFSPQNTDTVMLVVNPWCRSYYYVDDICVSEDSATCDWPTAAITELNHQDIGVTVYPNPTDGIVTISTLESIKGVEVYNTLRQTLFKQTGRVKAIDLKNFDPGAYIALITTTTGFYVRKILLYK